MCIYVRTECEIYTDFVHTPPEKEAEQLMIENLSKNMSDADEYPVRDISAQNASNLRQALTS